MYFESHAHYDDKRFNPDRDTLLSSLEKVDVIINVGADMKSTRASLELAKRYSKVFATVGVHPHEADSLSEDKFSQLEALAKEDKVVAIGEIGLDFYYDNSSRESQRFWFKRQLELAKKLNFPVVIHSREAAQETFDIIKDSGVACGVIHCFSETPELAKEYVKLGFYLGIGGVVTFGKKLARVVEEISLEHLLIETDCPYLAPAPKRGERNDSSLLFYIADKIAQLKKIDHDTVAAATHDNGMKLFFDGNTP